jgi:hypothetical protein
MFRLGILIGFLTVVGIGAMTLTMLFLIDLGLGWVIQAGFVAGLIASLWFLYQTVRELLGLWREK